MSLIGCIGCGNMGGAIIKGLAAARTNDQIIITDINSGMAQSMADQLGVTSAQSNKSCVKQSKYIVLAVKPQYYRSVLAEVKEVLTSDHILISIAPGITIQKIQDQVGDNIRIVRAMPNTPALIGAGMSGVCYDETIFDEKECQTIERIFHSFGNMIKVPESMMNAVVCASGSSPAYVYLFIEALADSVVKYGIPRDQAYQMAAQTLIGSAKMVLETGEHPGKLKDQVCSPGGTTIAAIAALEEWGFRNAVMKATDACYRKAEELS